MENQGNDKRNEKDTLQNEEGSNTGIDATNSLYLIITNISKRTNIKSLLMSAVAFGCTKIFVAGQKKFDFSGSDLPRSLQAMQARGELDIMRFDKLEECVYHVKNVVKASICGVEIVDGARDVDSEPFTGDTALMMGNEGSGMNKKQMDACDYFVRIGQFGGGTASLNVYVAASIVLHRFHHWARRKNGIDA